MNTPLRPAVPFIDMQVRAADGCYFDLDQYIGAANIWNFYLPNLCPWCGTRFHHRQHRVRHFQISTEPKDSSTATKDRAERSVEKTVTHAHEFSLMNFSTCVLTIFVS